MTKLFLGFLVACGCLVLNACVTQELVTADGRTVAVPQSSTDQGISSPDDPKETKERKSSKAHTALGMAYLRLGRLGVAQDEAKFAVRIDPTYANAQLLAGIVYDALQMPDKARPFFMEAARLAPADPEVGNAYGWFQCSHGQEQAGLVWLERSARSPYNQKPELAWMNAGLCHDRLKDDAGAEAAFQRSSQLNARFPNPQVYLAILSYRKHQYERAKQYIDRAQQLIRRPGPDVLWLAARIERKLGNDDTVRVYVSKLKKDFPTSTEYQNFLQGKFE